MDWEVALLSKVVHAGAIEPAVTSGIGERHFLSPENQQVWRLVQDHYQRTGNAPSLQYIASYFPALVLPIVTDTTEIVLEEFMIDAKRRHATQAVRDLARAVDTASRSDMLEIDARFAEAARDLALLVPTPQIGRFSEMANRVDKYKTEMHLPRERGIPYGIVAIDQLTGGIRPHEFISVIGWQGTGKSTLAQYICMSAWADNRKVLYFSMEMGAQDLLGRWDTMATNFLYQSWRDYELSEDEMLAWERMAASAAEFSAERDILVLDEGGYTTDRVYAEIVKWKPDLVVIDYLTLMTLPKADSMWIALTALTQQLKSICMSQKVPIIGIAQTNIEGARAGAQLENIAYARSIGQDSDISIGLHQPREMRDVNKMEVRLLKNRLGRQVVTPFYWQPDRMKFGEWTEEGMFKRRNEEEPATPMQDVPVGYAPGEINDDDMKALEQLERLMRSNSPVAGI